MSWEYETKILCTHDRYDKITNYHLIIISDSHMRISIPYKLKSVLFYIILVFVVSSVYINVAGVPGDAGRLSGSVTQEDLTEWKATVEFPGSIEAVKPISGGGWYIIGESDASFDEVSTPNGSISVVRVGRDRTVKWENRIQKPNPNVSVTDVEILSNKNVGIGTYNATGLDPYSGYYEVDENGQLVERSAYNSFIEGTDSGFYRIEDGETTTIHRISPDNREIWTTSDEHIEFSESGSIVSYDVRENKVVITRVKTSGAVAWEREIQTESYVTGFDIDISDNYVVLGSHEFGDYSDTLDGDYILDRSSGQLKYEVPEGSAEILDNGKLYIHNSNTIYKPSGTDDYEWSYHVSHVDTLDDIESLPNDYILLDGNKSYSVVSEDGNLLLSGEVEGEQIHSTSGFLWVNNESGVSKYSNTGDLKWSIDSEGKEYSFGSSFKDSFSIDDIYSIKDGSAHVLLTNNPAFVLRQGGYIAIPNWLGMTQESGDYVDVYDSLGEHVYAGSVVNYTSTANTHWIAKFEEEPNIQTSRIGPNGPVRNSLAVYLSSFDIYLPSWGLLVLSTAVVLSFIAVTEILFFLARVLDTVLNYVLRAIRHVVSVSQRRSQQPTQQGSGTSEVVVEINSPLSRRQILTGGGILGLVSLSGLGINALREPPIAEISYRPSQPTVSEPVVFHAQGSAGDDFRWYFDNEQTPAETGEEISHTFEQPGIHTVELTARYSLPPQKSQTTVRRIAVLPGNQIPSESENREITIEEDDIEAHLRSTKSTVPVDSSATLQFSATNLIGNDELHVQLMIETPSDLYLTGARSPVSGAGLYTNEETVSPGESVNMRLTVSPQATGIMLIRGWLVYYFGDDIENRRVEETMFRISAVDEDDQQVSPISTSVPGA